MSGGRSYISITRNNLASLFSFINLGFIQVSNALIQILLIPLISRIVGLEAFGHVMVAASYAALVSMLINYGSNQSGIKDIALCQGDTRRLSEVFYTIYFTRALLFCISFVVLLVLHYYNFPNTRYFLLANAIVLAETLNPFFFFVGIQRLLLYNIANLIAKLISAIAIIICIRSVQMSPWVNFFLGAGSVLAHGLLFVYLIKKYRLGFPKIQPAGFMHYLRQNFYLTGNNLSVQLQQSFFLFTISGTGNPLILGAYSLCDKIVWSFRLLIISFSNAVYPRAVIAYQTKKEKWVHYKRKLNWLLAFFFLFIALAIFFGAPLITHFFTGNRNELSTIYIKSVCLVPFVAALNSLNVIDLLMKNEYRYIFLIALILLGISIAASLLFIQTGNKYIFGYYPVTVEIFSLPLYFYYIKKTRKNEGIAL